MARWIVGWIVLVQCTLALHTVRVSCSPYVYVCGVYAPHGTVHRTVHCTAHTTRYYRTVLYQCTYCSTTLYTLPYTVQGACPARGWQC